MKSKDKFQKFFMLVSMLLTVLVYAVFTVVMIGALKEGVFI